MICRRFALIVLAVSFLFLSAFTLQSPQTPTHSSVGIDLDVTYISREPRYNWDAAKKWPNQGETVTFTAHIINKGPVASGLFSFEWLVDNQVVASGFSNSLAAQEETTQEFLWGWQSGRHTIGFKADPQNQVVETAENNNLVQDVTDSMTIGFWVEQSVYDDFNSKLNGLGTYSWEDWAQYQITTYNDLLRQSQLPLAPLGVLTRLRLDKITIVSDGTLFNLNYQHAPIEEVTDVQWGFSVNEYLNCPWMGCYDISWNVHHELGHYLFGRVDLYALDVQGGDVDVRDSNGILIAGTTLLPYIAWDVVHYNSRAGADLMTTLDYPNPMFLSDHTVYSLNRDWPIGQRTHSGWTYIYDIPAEAKLKVLNNSDQPIPNVQVSIFQAVTGNGSSGPYSQYFDNVPDITGVTDTQGILSLGAKPFGNMENFWGLTAGDILVKLVHPTSGQTQFVWVEATDFNLAYWRGETTSYTHAIRFPEGPQRLHLSQNQVTFLVFEGGNPLPQKLDIAMFGEGIVQRWNVSQSTVPWLRTIPFSTNSGITFLPGPLSFVVDSASLPDGLYTTQITVGTNGVVLDSPQIITVTLSVVERKDFFLPLVIR